MTRRKLLSMGAATAALLFVPLRAARSALRRVRIGGPGGPVITVQPLPRGGFDGSSKLAG